MAVFDSNFIANPELSDVQKGNPLQLANQLVNLQGSQLANINAAKSIAANSAMSGIIQQATNPDGTIDYRKLHQLAAGDPNAAYNLQAATSAAQQSEGAQIGNASAQLEQTHERLGILGETLYGLAQDPQLTKDKISEATGNLVKQGIVPLDMAVNSIGEINSLPDDPAALKNYVVGHANRVASAQQQLEMNTQEYQQFSLPGGGSMLYGRRQTAPGGQGVAATFSPQLSPEALTQQVTVTGPDGRPYQTTLGQMLQAQGVNQSGQPSPQQSYDLPGIDHPTNASPVPGGVQVGPSTQQQQAWTAATARQQQREQQALDVPNRIASLAQAGQQLANLKDTDWAAGPKSGELANVLATLNTAGLHVDQSQVNSRASMVKYLENAINTSAQDAGFNGSDARLNAWKAGQPDPDKMPPQALKAALAYVRSQSIGQALMSQYVHNAAQGDQTKIGDAEQSWAQHYDANALYLATLPANQRNAVMAKMGPQAASLARSHLADMIQSGLVNPRDLARYGQADAGD